MGIIFQCPCGVRLTVADELAGRDVKCPKCARVTKAPAAGAEVLPEAVSVGATTPPPPVPPAPQEPVAVDEPDYPDVDHAGQRLRRDAVFFAPPPRDIGTVVSGHT